MKKQVEFHLYSSFFSSTFKNFVKIQKTKKNNLRQVQGNLLIINISQIYRVYESATCLILVLSGFCLLPLIFFSPNIQHFITECLMSLYQTGMHRCARTRYLRIFRKLCRATSFGRISHQNVLGPE